VILHLEEIALKSKIETDLIIGVNSKAAKRWEERKADIIIP
jgi:hypothetical protein